MTLDGSQMHWCLRKSEDRRSKSRCVEWIFQGRHPRAEKFFGDAYSRQDCANTPERPLDIFSREHASSFDGETLSEGGRDDGVLRVGDLNRYLDSIRVRCQVCWRHCYGAAFDLRNSKQAIDGCLAIGSGGARNNALASAFIGCGFCDVKNHVCVSQFQRRKQQHEEQGGGQGELNGHGSSAIGKSAVRKSPIASS